MNRILVMLLSVSLAGCMATQPQPYQAPTRDLTSYDVKITNNAQACLTPIVMIHPKYPADAARSGIQGWVRLHHAINDEGNVEDLKVVDAYPEGIFDNAARYALEKWRYKSSCNPTGEKTYTITQLDFRLQ